MVRIKTRGLKHSVYFRLSAAADFKQRNDLRLVTFEVKYSRG